MSYIAASPEQVKQVAKDLLDPLLADIRAALTKVTGAQHEAGENEKALRMELKSVIQRTERQAQQLLAVRKNILKRMADLENKQ